MEIRFGQLCFLAADHVILEDYETRKSVILHRTRIDSRSLHYRLRKDVEKTGAKIGDVRQFEMHYGAITFHQVQGLTLPKNLKVEINIDGMSPNAVYVGLSRTATLDQIWRIATDDLPLLEFNQQEHERAVSVGEFSYIYTHLPRLKKTMEQQYETCTSLAQFDALLTRRRRIARDIYENDHKQGAKLRHFPELDFLLRLRRMRFNFVNSQKFMERLFNRC